MSLIPEAIFQRSIISGLHTLRTDDRYIDQLFRNLSQGEQDQMRTFIKNNQVDLTINYPRSQLRIPAIVILLKSDNEATDGAYLDDYMGDDTPDEFGYDGGIEGQILGGTASQDPVGAPGKVLFGPHYVLSATLNTLKVSDRTFYNYQFMDGAELNEVRIVGGTGAGQIREITANTHNTIMVDKDWTTIPDTTSVFEVKAPGLEVIGQPAKLYDRRGSTVLERKGGLYTNKYQLQIVGANQNQVIYLYAIVKAIFTLSRIFMEGQGIINFRMSGTDFVNRSEYIPDLAYMRSMSIEFESPFDIYTPVGNLIENFTLCLTEGIEGVEADISTDPVSIGSNDPVITGP
jgi:hypothetical protein